MESARLVEIARLFTRLGFTAFGGPAAHLALMEDEVVNRRKWLDRQHFLDLVSAVNFIPGPNSTEVAIHLGLIRGGRIGLLVAGACFITPAMLIILPLAWLYARYGQTPQAQPALGAIGAAVIAIIAAAVWRFARTSINNTFTAIVAIVALALAILLRNERRFPPELAILALAALAGALRMMWMTEWRSARSLLIAPTAAAVSIVIPALPEFATMFLFFLRVGATLFGSGYVLYSYLHNGLVEQRGWLTTAQLADAVAVGQVTPGPLLTTATFIGYFLGERVFGLGVWGGIGCGVGATVAIFLPSFLFVLLLAPVLDRLRQNPIARGALDAMNAAVVSLILVVAVQLARPIFYSATAQLVAWLHIAIAVVSLVLLLWTKLNATWLILGAGTVGSLAWLIASS
jgi:chromate transporter